MDRYEYPRLHEMLNSTCPFAHEIKAKSITAIINKTIIEFQGAEESAMTNEELIRYVFAGMGSYLTSYRARSTFKQKLKEKLTAWYRSLEEMYQVETNNSVDMWPEYVQCDRDIELVKLLHNREHKTKAELAAALGVEKKTIQNCLRKLDPTLREAKQKNIDKPLRVGGQAMYVDINYEEKAGTHGDRSYWCPNTLHPLVMQLNVTQVATMLMALQKSYDNGQYGTYCSESALDIWCQLSDYCKDRIRTIFAESDPSFGTFLKMLEEDLEGGRFPTFKTERNMAEDATEQEKLDYACKTEHPCDLMLKIDGVRTFYQKIRIFKNYPDGYIGRFKDPETLEISTVSFTFDDVALIQI